MSDNFWIGSIPAMLGNLTKMRELQLGGNMLVGAIPKELSKMISLQTALNLSFNNLSGSIPGELQHLSLLENVYLQENGLSGEIPSSFDSWTSLVVFNISYNELQGTLPNTPTFHRMDVSNFLGNKGLCGSPLPIPCALPRNTSYANGTTNGGGRASLSNQSSTKLVIVIACVLAGVFLMVLLLFRISWPMYASRRRTQQQQQQQQLLMENDIGFFSGEMDHIFFYPKHGFTFQSILDATDNFSDCSMIGSGASGKVYRAKLPCGKTFAIKRLSAEGSTSLESSFLTELKTLGTISHGNIVKLYGYCYHQDANLLLYEYMPRGSLGEHLHVSDVCDLDWQKRYDIALGAAQGLAYLHHDCKPQIIHRDIKSNNILLDDNFKAHVGDFGLAKLIDIPHSKSMSAVVGSYGYIAPGT